MTLKVLTSLFFPLLLVSCATSPEKSEQNYAVKQQATSARAPSPVVLDRMDTSFLYLASQDALHKRQYGLAIRFLKAIVKKEPDAIAPRFELVDLLLANKQGTKSEAKVYMEIMPRVESLEGENLIQYQRLYARSLIANGEPEEASKLLEDILIKQPDNIEIRLLLARIYVVSSQYVKAHQVIKQGLERKKSLRLQNMQVQVYLQQGRLLDADKTLARMQESYPSHEDIVLQRAHLAEKQGSGVKAEILLQQFIDEHGKTAVQSYNMLAGIYVRQNRIDNAIVIYKRMLPLTGSDAEVLMSIGKLLYQQQKFSDAGDYFRHAVSQLTPQDKNIGVSESLATASFYYGASLEAAHQWGEAIPEYERLTIKHNLYADAQMRLASIDITHKRLNEAEKRLLTLKSLYSDDLGVYEMLAGLRLQQKQYKQVIEESNQARDLGYSKMLLFNRAVAFEKLKQFNELDKALDIMLGNDPNDAETLNFYGYSLADRGLRLAAAQMMIEKALALKPNDGFYLDSLAWVYFQQKNYVKALENQLKAVELIENDAVMMEHLGDIYWRSGDAKKARISWGKALEAKHDKPKKIKEKIENGLL